MVRGAEAYTHTHIQLVVSECYLYSVADCFGYASGTVVLWQVGGQESAIVHHFLQNMCKADIGVSR